MIEVLTHQYTVTSMRAERSGIHVHLSIWVHGRNAGSMTFGDDQREEFVWVACKLGGALLCCESDCPFSSHELDQLFPTEAG